MTSKHTLYGNRLLAPLLTIIAFAAFGSPCRSQDGSFPVHIPFEWSAVDMGEGVLSGEQAAAGAPATDCEANAGTLTANNATVCYTGGPVNLSAAWSNSVVPSGYQAIFLLTTGATQVIVQGSFTPAFNVTATGVFTIHALVFNSSTLNLGGLVFGQSELGDLNAMLIQGGGTICAGLDMEGASVSVVVCPPPCEADAGTFTADLSTVCFDAGTATISGTGNGDAEVPPGFQTVYVLTSGVDLVIEATAPAPSFTVNAIGDYTLHTLVYDPLTLDLGTIVIGETTGGEVNALLVQGGGTICGSLDVVGAPVTVEVCLAPCEAEAGTILADDGFVCLGSGPAEISATPNGDAVVPVGYQTVYVLTTDVDLVIEAADIVPTFSVSSAGSYTIHTLVYDPTTLDLGTIVFGETTGSEVNALLIQGGGTICGSLDVAGAPIIVDVCLPPCEADAGTLTADEVAVCFEDGSAIISATANGDAVVPTGFQTVYVLTSGPDLVIEATDALPSFVVTATGDYTLHTLVYDPNTLDLGSIVPGETTGGDVNALLIQGGGTICASLDVAGAPITVELCCDALSGTLTADDASVCFEDGSATIGATANGDAVVPTGFQTVYVLTSGPDLVIEATDALPSFVVTATGDYTLHTLVYDPNTLDLGSIVPGETTGGDVNALLIQGGGTICASLDVAGAGITVELCCDAVSGTLTADEATVCFLPGGVTISATPNGDAVVPDGFQTVYVLTSGPDLVIQAADALPSFVATSTGDHTIHTLVYDPLTLDLGSIVLGVTTGGDVNALLIQGGGIICASLDVAGAPIVVEDCSPVNDDCGNAVPVAVSLVDNCTGNAVFGNNTYATQEVGNEPGCDATSAYYADVWYTFNSGENSEISILLDPGTMTDWALTVTDACSGGSELACEINPSAPIDVNTTPNTDYWVRVYSNVEFGDGGEFALCITGAVPTFICDGGEVLGPNGETSIDVCQDGDADVIDFNTSSVSVEAYAFLVTDEANTIVTPMAGNSLDFNALPLGTYRVWGVSFNGTLEGAVPGGSASEITSTGACVQLSSDFVMVNVEICSGVGTKDLSLWDLYPNPSNGAFSVRYAGNDALVTLEVIDMDGRFVVQERSNMVHGQVYTMEYAGRLASGPYTVRLSTGGSVRNLRLLVQ